MQDFNRLLAPSTDKKKDSTKSNTSQKETQKNNPFSGNINKNSIFQDNTCFCCRKEADLRLGPAAFPCTIQSTKKAARCVNYPSLWATQGLLQQRVVVIIVVARVQPLKPPLERGEVGAHQREQSCEERGVSLVGTYCYTQPVFVDVET